MVTGSKNAWRNTPSLLQALTNLIRDIKSVTLVKRYGLQFIDALGLNIQIVKLFREYLWLLELT